MILKDEGKAISLLYILDPLNDDEITNDIISEIHDHDKHMDLRFYLDEHNGNTTHLRK